MSAFYGTIQGHRGQATRGGTKNSGFKATAQSWDGSLITNMSYDSEGKLIVELQVSDGSAVYGDRIFKGTLEDLVKKLGGTN